MKIMNLKNESQWQIATSRNKRGHSTNTTKNTLERNRKSNNMYFKLRNRFYLYITMIKTQQQKDQQVQFLMYLKKSHLVETHLQMKLILLEIKDC